MHRTLLSLALIAALSGCSTSETPAPSPAPAGSANGTGTETGDDTKTPDTETPSDTTPSETTAPKAPKLTQLMKMGGALHVVWTNVDDSCDSVVGERKSSAADYKVAFTVPGEVDNKMDSDATGAETFTYRLRCKKGETFSAYSNEMSGKP